MLLLNQISNYDLKQIVWQKLSVSKKSLPTLWPKCDNTTWNQTWNQTSKSQAQWSQEGGGGEGLCLHSQEGQDLCACTAAEELMFKTSSEHQTVNLSNKCMTKDFLRDFRHGFTVHGGQEDRTFDM
jgi:hypothetical protein